MLQVRENAHEWCKLSGCSIGDRRLDGMGCSSLNRYDGGILMASRLN